MTGPKIIDDDAGIVEINLDGDTLKTWIYGDRSEQKAKMALAWAWMDGYTCRSRESTSHPEIVDE